MSESESDEDAEKRRENAENEHHFGEQNRGDRLTIARDRLIECNIN